MNTNNVNPQSIFGGIWQKIEGRFLLGSSSSYVLGSLGGEATHTLTISEMPSHNHKYIYKIMYGVGGYGHKTSGEIYTIANNNNNLESQFDNYSSNTGGSQPHNNMPPYLAVYIYMEKDRINIIIIN